MSAPCLRHCFFFFCLLVFHMGHFARIMPSKAVRLFMPTLCQGGTAVINVDFTNDMPHHYLLLDNGSQELPICLVFENSKTTVATAGRTEASCGG